MKESTKTTESYVIPGQMYLEHNGKLIEMGKAEVVTSTKPTNKNFYMLFLESFSIIPWIHEIFELDFLIYLIRNMNKDNTVTFVTDSKLAKKFNVCRQTIATYKQKLANAQIIKYGKNIIMVNPYIIYKGGVTEKEKAQSKYNSIKQEIKQLSREEVIKKLEKKRKKKNGTE